MNAHISTKMILLYFIVARKIEKLLVYKSEDRITSLMQCEGIKYTAIKPLQSWELQ